MVKEVKLMSQSRGTSIRIHQYLDDWLTRAPTKESCHQGTQSILTLCQELGGKPTKVGVGTLTGIRVCGLQVQSLSGTGQIDPEPLGVNSPEGGIHSGQSNVPSQEVHVTDRPCYSNGKTGSPGETSHETQSVAPQKALEGPRICRKGDSSSKISSCASSMVDQGDKCLTRPTSASFASCHSNLYRRLKRRLRCSLRRLHSKQHLVSSRKPSCKFPGTKSCIAIPKKIPTLSSGKSCSSCHRQHYSGIHQQGGRYEVRLTLCPSMGTTGLVQSDMLF